MCFIFTTLAAIATTLLWRLKYTAKKYKLDTLAFMYWGAAIMWLVDCVYSAAAGAGFLDISANDACLGIVIICIGIAAWAVILTVSKIKTKAKRNSHKA